MLMAALRARRGNPATELVDDLVQEAYCRLLTAGGRSLRCFRGTTEAELVGFLGRVAESVVVDHQRRHRALRRALDRDDLEPTVEVPDWLVRRGAGPEERVLTRERRGLFWRRCRASAALRGPTWQRNLAILRWTLLEGRTSREVSRALAGTLSPSSIDSMVSRLRSELARSGLAIPTR
jgi:DNA-directed RNA polymerase specialized sigma24 family protein